MNSTVPLILGANNRYHVRALQLLGQNQRFNIINVRGLISWSSLTKATSLPIERLTFDNVNDHSAIEYWISQDDLPIGRGHVDR